MPDKIIEKYTVFKIFPVNNFCRDSSRLSNGHGYGRFIFKFISNSELGL